MCVRERGGEALSEGTRWGLERKEPNLVSTPRGRLFAALSLSPSLTPNAKKKAKKAKSWGNASPRPLRSFFSQPPSLNRNRMSRSRRPSGWSSVSPSEEGKRPPSEMRFTRAPEKSPRFRSVSRFAVVSLGRSGHGAPKSECLLSRSSRSPSNHPKQKHYAHRWNPASWPRSGRASRP